jgi:adenylate kinase family enzyme
VFHLLASEVAVSERLAKRGRPDDTDETIATRFREHKEVTLPILNFYKGEGVPVHEIDGEKPPEQVHEAMIDVIHERLPKIDKDKLGYLPKG